MAQVHLVPTRKQPALEAMRLIDLDTDIYLGDFNLSGTQLSSLLFKHKPNIYEKTSLKRKETVNGYTHKRYDNILTRNINVIGAGVLDFVPFRKDLSDALKISDHLPVFVRIKK
jgi:deoxyribonuclease-1-like protein